MRALLSLARGRRCSVHESRRRSFASSAYRLEPTTVRAFGDGLPALFIASPMMSVEPFPPRYVLDARRLRNVARTYPKAVADGARLMLDEFVGEGVAKEDAQAGIRAILSGLIPSSMLDEALR